MSNLPHSKRSREHVHTHRPTVLSTAALPLTVHSFDMKQCQFRSLTQTFILSICGDGRAYPAYDVNCMHQYALMMLLKFAIDRLHAIRKCTKHTVVHTMVHGIINVICDQQSSACCTSPRAPYIYALLYSVTLMTTNNMSSLRTAVPSAVI